MLYFSKLRVISVIIFSIILSYFAISNFFKADDDYFSKNIKLGLDLQGGSYLLLEIDNKPVITQKLQSKVIELKKFFKNENIIVKNFSILKNSILFDAKSSKIEKLQFKKNRVYVIGTDEGDYLDEIFESVGIRYKSQVTTTSVGIFWVNENGLYGYNGEGLTNFTEGKIAQKKWKNSISSWVLYEDLAPSIGYLRKENK